MEVQSESDTMPTNPEYPGCRVYSRPRSPYFYLEYTDPNTGKPLRVSSGKTSEQDAWRELGRRLQRASEPSWKEAVVHFIQTRQDLKPTTMHQYRNSIRVLDPMFGDQLLCDINMEHIKAFVHERRQQVSDASVRRDLATGSTIFAHAQLTLPRSGVPQVNPFQAMPKRHLKENRRNRYLTQQEYSRVEGALTEEWHRVALEAFVYTGFRHREMRMFQWDWVSWDRGPYGEIQLPREYAKNGEPRIIPLFPKFRRTLEDWCARSESDHVFAHWSRTKGEWVSYTSFQGFWKGARKRAGIKDVRIHDLRHTFASWWVQKGGHMSALKELLGHADLRMVDRYAHLNTEAQHTEVNRIHELM